MQYNNTFIEASSGVTKSTDALVHFVSRLIVPVMAVVLFAACESPVAVSPDGTTASYSSTSDRFSGDDTEGVYQIEEDGTARRLTTEEESALLSAPGQNRTELLVVGQATYANPTVKTIQFNVRQTAAGDVIGGGRVTIGNQTIDATPLCIKPLNAFGRMQYGVGVELHEPYVFTTPYGTISYQFVSLSVTETGEYSGMLASNRAPVCGASALLTPIAVEAGSLQVITPERRTR